MSACQLKTAHREILSHGRARVGRCARANPRRVREKDAVGYDSASGASIFANGALSGAFSRAFNAEAKSLSNNSTGSGNLSAGAQAIVDKAMSQANGNVGDAYDLVGIWRGNNVTDPDLRDAEHYMYARWFTDATYGTRIIPLSASVNTYSMLKTLMWSMNIAGPGEIWNTSSPSWSEWKAGWAGMEQGLRDLTSGQPKGR